jgi:hypothetical protein
MPELEDAVSGEQIDRDENDSANPESDIDRDVDQFPIRGNLGEVPGTREVEYQ